MMIFSLTAIFISCNDDNSASSPPLTPTNDGENQNQISKLNGTTWILSTINEANVDETCLFELSFSEKNGHYLESKNCCKNCEANYHIDETHFSIIEGTFRSDPWDCKSSNMPSNLIQQENAYFDMLLAIASYNYQNNTLQFEDSTGSLVLEFARKEDPTFDPALEGTQWDLISMNGTKLIEGTHISLNFEDSRISGFGGVNTYGVTPSVANNGILRIYSSIISTSIGSFGGDITKQEGEYLRMLQDSDTYQFTSTYLELRTASNDILTFEPATENS